jgi:hypothetical protein
MDDTFLKGHELADSRRPAVVVVAAHIVVAVVVAAHTVAVAVAAHTDFLVGLSVLRRQYHSLEVSFPSFY